MDMGIPAMTKCCNQLDMCYDTCGSNKYRCDSKFRWCLHSICSDLKKSLGFVSKVEGQWNFLPFHCFMIRKETIAFLLLNGGIDREWRPKEDFGMIHDFFLIKKHLNWDVNAVLSLCFVPSVWNSGRHIVQHSVDPWLQTLHEQPESSLLLPRGGKRWTLNNCFQSLSYL